ncbi:MAG: acyltransferase [Oscillospiraceae bacterium]|nr:acyltransferase [Oscillospiraceae bacterium]
MFSKILGLLNKIIYKIRFGKSICFEGIPGFVTHMQIYVKSGKVKTGKNFVIKQGVYIAAVNGGKINIGNNVSINRNCILVSHDSISIGDNCAVGPNTIFYDHDHKFGINGIENGFKTAPIIVEDNCWIGAGVTILRGTHIGEGCIIGAGTIVKGNIPAHSLVTSERSIKIVSIKNREE